MQLAALIMLAVLASPALADEPPIIALDADDAEQCKQGKCILIAPKAFKALTERIQRGDEYEAAAHELARKIVADRRNRCA